MSDLLNRIAFVTKPPTRPKYSPFGYIIIGDGSTYALAVEWAHGLVLACLFPDKTAEAGLELPGDLCSWDKRAFQQFELDYGDTLEAIRVCPSRLLGPPTVDRGSGPVTPQALEAFRLVVTEIGLEAQDTVALDYKDVPLKDVFGYLRSARDVWSYFDDQTSKD